MGSLDSNPPEAPSSRPEFNPLNIEEFRKTAHFVVDFIADYYKNIENYHVLSQVKPGYLRFQQPETPPNLPEPLDTILEDVRKKIIPGLTHWLSPSFFAFFPASVSTASFAGEMLCTGFNSVGFNWLASPAATELEMVVMDWLAHMLNLPTSFMFSRGTGGGTIQSTTSESILCTLVAARDTILDVHAFCNISKLVVYGSDQTHSTFAKACKIAGILQGNIRSLPTTIESDFSLSPEVLEAAMAKDIAQGLVPLYVCANIGTTSTTAVDPLRAIAEVAGRYGAWVHVDAAYAGGACICPEFRRFLDGVEKVDSLSFSPQKWLLSHVDCCCMWLRKPGKLVRALKTSPEYMRNRYSDSRSVVDYQDWQIGSGRRFKALRLWMVLRSYGVAKLQEHIRSDVGLATAFEAMVRSDRRFEVMVPRKFSLVCFRFRMEKRIYVENEIAEMNKRLLELINSTGRIYITHTITGGVYMLRFAVGGTLTEYRHVRDAWDLIKGMADELQPTTDMISVVTAAVEGIHIGKHEKKEAYTLPPPIHGRTGW